VSVEESVARRVEELLVEAQRLRRGNEYGQVLSEQHSEACRGWIAAAANVVELIAPSPTAAYHREAERIRGHNYGFAIPGGVGEMAELLTNLLKDARAGLVSSVADHARAEVFDDFLDHARSYLKSGRKNEAGVIAGVVFEDSLRRICRKHQIEERGKKLDDLISELAKSEQLTATKAKRARVSADLRTKATHAQWDEFDIPDVATTIEFTSELISNHLDA
jgi:hypothetical protein